MHLNCHSWFSLRYGLMRPAELVGEAVESGVSVLALTDVNATSGCWDFVRAAEAKGVRPVLGVDFRNGASCCYVGIARDNAGYEELCAHLSQGLSSGSRWEGRAPNFERVAVVYPWKLWQIWAENGAVLGPDEWVGVRPWELGELRLWEGNAERRSLVPWDRLVAHQTATFRNKRDWNCHRILRAVEGNVLLSKLANQMNENPATGHPYDRMMSPQNTFQAYAERPELVDRANALLDGCRIAWPAPKEGRMHNNQQTYTDSEQADDRLLRKLCTEGLAYRFPQHNKVVLERMERELAVIRQQAYVAYFLINWDITRYARQQGYFYVGRGSGANSLVAYLLRITNVDPIELDLYFERFINVHRSNPPDFDIDFSWTDRDDMTRYIFERFEHVALVGAYSTFQFRAVVRELGKVFGLPKHEIDGLVRGGARDGGALDAISEIAQVVLRYSKYLQDFPNTLTVHSCGIVIADRPISAFCGTFMPPKGYPTTQFDMLVAEDVGLYKFDILSQRGLGKIRDALALVTLHDPEKAAAIDIHDMKRFKEDPRIRDMLRNAQAVGCFYVESPAMRMLLRKLEVDTYLGLVAASSVIRPGVARSGMMQAYIERHRNPERRKDAPPILLELMPETYGVMVYQEDVIKVAHHFAGLDLGEADVLRRGMSGKFRSRAEFAKTRQTFIDKAIANGRSAPLVTEIWNQVESFAGYSFAKGHSASYAVESYQSLFLKAHWPLAYMTACINNFGGFYSTEFYVHEARMLGAKIEAPCVNHGGWEAVWVPDSGQIFLGFHLVRGLESNTLDRVIHAREAGLPFQALGDFIERTAVSLEQAVLMIRAGGLRFTGRTKQQLLWEAHFLLGHPRGAKGAASERSLFESPARSFTLPPLASGTREEAFDQIELIGFPLVPPFCLLTESAARIAEAGMPAQALIDCIREKRYVDVVGYLVTVKETVTARGERMAFGCFIDRQGHWLDTVHFPPALRTHPFRGGGIYRIKGPIRCDYGCVHVEARELEKLAYIPDPRYSEDGKPGPSARPSNSRKPHMSSIRAPKASSSASYATRAPSRASTDNGSSLQTASTP